MFLLKNEPTFQSALAGHPFGTLVHGYKLRRKEFQSALAEHPFGTTQKGVDTVPIEVSIRSRGTPLWNFVSANAVQPDEFQSALAEHPFGTVENLSLDVAAEVSIRSRGTPLWNSTPKICNNNTRLDSDFLQPLSYIEKKHPRIATF